MPRKVFTAGEILTAANLNDVSDQSVMVFDDNAARTTAIPTPVEGMVTYLKDTDAVQKFNGSAFVGVADPPAILQVVSVAKVDTFSTASGTLTDVTGLTVSITPSSASNEVLVLVTVVLGSSGSGQYGVTLVDGSDNNLLVASSPGNRVPAFYLRNDNNEQMTPASFTILHSPNTTSAFTYKVRALTSAGTLFVNKSGLDTDSASLSRGVSTITVMEVAG